MGVYTPLCVLRVREEECGGQQGGGGAGVTDRLKLGTFVARSSLYPSASGHDSQCGLRGEWRALRTEQEAAQNDRWLLHAQAIMMGVGERRGERWAEKNGGGKEKGEMWQYQNPPDDVETQQSVPRLFLTRLAAVEAYCWQEKLHVNTGGERVR